MQYLVGKGRVQDKRESDHAGAQQRQRGHAVAGFPEILHQGELVVRVGPDQPRIKTDVVRRRFQVAIGQGRLGAPEINPRVEIR